MFGKMQKVKFVEKIADGPNV